ncbi:ABC transporter ATP-binding protein [Methylobacterium platani]|uniref:Microcin ABC transporter ATP-binding protein n=2 Tax=Methylobacterium platani TaxID=427683 RepID=A0A179S1S2_9HYPH|nr:dipeptide ABC transporter ATP-binding protein [Methylobacterium platani]KMO20194.1 microcin ABC transporter ATP-binding protein [Methylobacterium platani JCM 14648]OAS19588.1 microcin ABC transporter ATP-binding protein [Methylobacterium platani]
MTLLSLRGLAVRYPEAGVTALAGLDLDLARGETLALVGESGSGKSQVALATLGLLPPQARVSGSVRFDGAELTGLPRPTLDRIRGARIGLVFQEPMTALDPLFPVGRQIALPLRAHRSASRRQALDRARELMGLVGIRDAASRLSAYPHELSGGERQRVMIAMALACEPDLLIADEPTTALDVTVQAQILALLADLKRRLGLALLFITHDLRLVRRIAERTAVLHAGRLVEVGPTERLFRDPRAPETRDLVAAEPAGRKGPVPGTAPVVLAARGVTVAYPGPRRGWRPGPPRLAVDGIDLTLRAGQTLGVVGESGSGKSSLGRALLRLEPAAHGLVRFEDRDLTRLDRAALRPLRRGFQPVFQDPMGSLSPRLTAGEIVAEGLRVHEPHLTAASRDARAAEAFREVRLDPAWRHRFPHAFSGGQRQRIAIARALALRPRLVVLDEPTSALDRTVQRDIVALLRELQAAHGLAYVFISHDLAVVRALADTVLVLRHGREVERGPTDRVLESPREAYTRALVAAADLDPGLAQA